MSSNPFDPQPPTDNNNPYLQRLGASAPTPTTPVSNRSTLATISLVFSLISPLLACVCGMSLFSSLAAVVSGHIALVRIKRSRGTLTGRGAAIAGLVIGYPMLAVSIGLVAIFAQSFREGFTKAREAEKQRNAPGYQASADARFHEAELKITGNSQGVAHGNSDEARQLARDFSEKMKALRDELFTKGKKRTISLTGGEFVTYCELHSGRCAFMVHVPQYRDYTQDAKESLAEVAWMAAQVVVKDKMQDGDRLAVGLKGALLFGAIMIGNVDADSETPETTAAEDAFEEFFASPAKPAETPEPSAPPTPSDIKPEAEPNGTKIPDGAAAPQTPGTIPAERLEPNVPTITPEIPRSDPPSQSLGSETQATDATPPGNTSAKRKSRIPITSSTVKLQNAVASFPNMEWSVTSLAFSPDSRWLAVGKMDRTVLLIDVLTSTQLSVVKDRNELGQITALAFSPDQRRLYVGGYSGKLHLWNVDSDGKLDSPRELRGHSRKVGCILCSSDGRLVISGGEDKQLIWQQPDNPQNIRNLEAFERGVLAVALTPDRPTALATDGRALLSIDLRKSEVARRLPLENSPAFAADFSPDRCLVACNYGTGIQIWETETGTPLPSMRASPSTRSLQSTVRFTPDNARIVSGAKGGYTLWNVGHSDAESFTIGSILHVQTLAVSPDGRYLAVIAHAAGQNLHVLRLSAMTSAAEKEET